MTNSSIMHSVNTLLTDFGLTATTSKGEKDLPYEASVVEFGFDEKNRPIAVQILLYSQNLLAAIHEAEKEPNPENLHIMSFIMTVPTEIPEKTTGEVLQLLCLANKSLPLGALNFSKAEKSAYYTYSLPIFDEPPSEQTLLSILQTAVFVKDTFFSTIDDVATGQTTVEQILSVPDEKQSEAVSEKSRRRKYT